ncbi:MAG TPA: hypothetical protein VJ456_14255 [Acidimicrobiia bacterium]|nr:hypothetical protein [Acidimicrobiia bacterium]
MECWPKPNNGPESSSPSPPRPANPRRGAPPRRLVGIRYAQGRLGELEPALRQAVDRVPGVAFFRAVLALASCEADRPGDARATVAPLIAGDVDRLVCDYFAT